MKKIVRAFTLVELLTVIAVIAILAGITISTMGYAQRKGARSRTEAEIRAMEAALEGYKADNGTYPRSTATDGLRAGSNGLAMTFDPSGYKAASGYLYQQLSGDLNGDLKVSGTLDGQRYMEFNRKTMLYTTGTVYITDAFGMSYGYSTAYLAASATVSGTTTVLVGFNPTFDLWSTGGKTDSSGTSQWITNWQ